MVFINTELLSFTDENSVDLDNENRVPYLHADLAERTLGPVKSISITASVTSD
jgi:hypothetical protein